MSGEETITVAGHGRWNVEDGEFVLQQQVTCFCEHANEITDELGICIQNGILPSNQPTWIYEIGELFPNYTVIPGGHIEPNGYVWKPITVTTGAKTPSKPILMRDYLQQFARVNVKLAICRNQKGVLAEWVTRTGGRYGK